MSTAVPEPTAHAGRAASRAARHRDVLAGARRIVTADGLPGLTMQRLADDLGCGVGSLYRLFPSKDALVADLEQAGLEVVTASFEASQGHLGHLLAARGVHDPALVALARAVAAAHFWVEAETVFPQEIELSRRVLLDPAPRDGAAATPARPTSRRFLELVRQLLDDAAAQGAMHEGSSLQRASVVIAGATGVLLASALEGLDDALPPGPVLASLLVHDLFVGWGADPDRLSLVEGIAGTLAEQRRLVPPVPR